MPWYIGEDGDACFKCSGCGGDDLRLVQHRDAKKIVLACPDCWQEEDVMLAIQRQGRDLSPAEGD